MYYIDELDKTAKNCIGRHVLIHGYYPRNLVQLFTSTLLKQIYTSMKWFQVALFQTLYFLIFNTCVVK